MFCALHYKKLEKNLLGHLLYRSVLLTQNGNNSTSLPSCRNLLINNEVALRHWTRQSYGCHQNDANTLPSAESESRSPRIQRSVLLPKESSWTWKRFGHCQTIVTRMCRDVSTRVFQKYTFSTKKYSLSTFRHVKTTKPIVCI